MAATGLRVDLLPDHYPSRRLAMQILRPGVSTYLESTDSGAVFPVSKLEHSYPKDLLLIIGQSGFQTCTVVAATQIRPALRCKMQLMSL